jgi:phosphate-selective porin OprO and OprP
MKTNKTLLIGLITALSATSTTASAETLEERVAKLEAKLSSKKHSDVKVFGKLQFDKTLITADDTNLSLQNNSKLRSGRIGAKGKVDGGWKYKAEIDFAGNNSTVKDAYIAKKLSDNEYIKIGQFREPFSLEELTSSSNTTFLERASINGVVAARKIGIGYNKRLNNLNIQTGIFGDSVGTSSDTDDETNSATIRISKFNNNENSTLHIGAAYRLSEPTGDSVTYNFKPEASVETSSSVISAAVSNVEQVTQTGLELAYVKNRFYVQGEYITTNLEIDNADDQTIDGYYGQISYFLTNDKRNYNEKESVFGGVKPSSKKGAVEVAYRYSKTDASDTGNGIVRNNTAAISWYASNNVRFIANYVWVNADDNTTYANDTEILGARAQINF